MPELKAYHHAISKPIHLVKQISDCALQFEIVGAGDVRAGALAAQTHHTHHSHIPIENWLPCANRYALNAAELVLAHQVYERALLSGQISSP